MLFVFSGQFELYVVVVVVVIAVVVVIVYGKLRK